MSWRRPRSCPNSCCPNRLCGKGKLVFDWNTVHSPQGSLTMPSLCMLARLIAIYLNTVYNGKKSWFPARFVRQGGCRGIYFKTFRYSFAEVFSKSNDWRPADPYYMARLRKGTSASAVYGVYQRFTASLAAAPNDPCQSRLCTELSLKARPQWEGFYGYFGCRPRPFSEWQLLGRAGWIWRYLCRIQPVRQSFQQDAFLDCLYRIRQHTEKVVPIFTRVHDKWDASQGLAPHQWRNPAL